MLRKINILVFVLCSLLFAGNKIVDLNVDTLKVTGVFKGPAKYQKGLELIATKIALGENYDVLVGANIFREIQGDSIKIIVSGYPAKYGGISAERKFSPYISVKYQTSKAFPADNYYFSPYGANIEFGGIINKFFISTDFGVTWFDIGGGMSFGKVKQINEQFSIILGGSVGAWLLGADFFDTYGFAIGGFFTKMIFGKENIKFEISNRLIGPLGLSYQLGIGLTIAPSIGKTRE